MRFRELDWGMWRSPMEGQSLAVFHGAKTGEARPWLGVISGAAKNERQSLEESRNRSKVASDQRGHGIGVSLDVYSKFRPGAQERGAMKNLEASASKTATLRSRRSQKAVGLMA